MPLDIAFVELCEEHLPLIERWLQLPHVKAYFDSGPVWSPSHERFILGRSTDWESSYIFTISGIPVGYIQSYWPAYADEEWSQTFDDDTVGVDLYIGEPDYLDKGVGTKLLTAFVERLFENPAVGRIILDPEPDNARAIACYRKVGFREVGPVETPDGPALLMERYR